MKLKSQGFPLHEVICYDTCASADVGERLTSIVKEKVRMGTFSYGRMKCCGVVCTCYCALTVNIIHWLFCVAHYSHCPLTVGVS